jgi:hypothetical protein
MFSFVVCNDSHKNKKGDNSTKILKNDMWKNEK